MARARKRAKQRQRRQRSGDGKASQQSRSDAPFEAEAREEEAPGPADEASAYAEEAKLALGGGESSGDLVPDFGDEEGDLSELAEEAEAASESDPTLERARARARRLQERGGEDIRGRGGTRFGNFLRACWAELMRVQWPDRRQVAQATGVVLGFVLVAGAYLGLLDLVFSKIMNRIL